MTFKKILHSRYEGMIIFSFVFLMICFVTRLILFFMSVKEIDLSIINILQVFGVGLFFDLIVLLYINTIGSLINLFITDKSLTKRLNRFNSLLQYFVFIFIFVFGAFAEFFFWEEFTSRFNFIAVDYLIYTQEVANNIWQSYPMVWLWGAMGLITAILFAATYRFYARGLLVKTTFRQRFLVFGVMAILSGLSLLVNNSMAELSPNRIKNELSKNGIYSIFSAFRQNTLSYEDFYLTLDTEKVFHNLRTEYDLKSDDPLPPEDFTIQRKIKDSGREKRLNVVMVVVESLSAEFLGCYGNTLGLTPNLDAIADKSLVFTNLYATGTRTTRGLEAITLSVPPTPGRSVVKRPDNHGLFTLGTVFNEKGYETEFLYGGRGFFDNMNSFFGGNGFKVLDETNFSKEEVHFSNAWGVCDGDLFDKTISECDRNDAAGTPFFKLIMTTSNHRPYTYPDTPGIPSDPHRANAVKYTDYAIGQLIEKARSKPWFENTVFVIIADHCANSAGRLDIEIAKYHIPLIIYSPAHIQPKVVDTLCSQIDLGPTLLGLLNLNYTSQFYGKDVLRTPPERAFIGTYQKIGLYDGQMFYVLLPGKGYEGFLVENENEAPVSVNLNQMERTIAFYQTAGYLLEQETHHLEQTLTYSK